MRLVAGCLPQGAGRLHQLLLRATRLFPVTTLRRMPRKRPGVALSELPFTASPRRPGTGEWVLGMNKRDGLLAGLATVGLLLGLGAPPASATALVNMSLHVCAPTSMHFPNGQGNVYLSLNRSDYSTGGFALDDSPTIDTSVGTSAIRDSSGCWTVAKQFPAGDASLSLELQPAQPPAGVCWTKGLAINAPVTIADGTLLSINLPQPRLIDLDVYAPSGAPVTGALVKWASDGSSDFQQRWHLSTTTSGTTVTQQDTVQQTSYQYDQGSSGGVYQCPTGKMALFSDTDPTTVTNGQVAYQMPDGSTQYTSMSDSWADGVMTATLPYDVPLTDVSVGGVAGTPDGSGVDTVSTTVDAGHSVAVGATVNLPAGGGGLANAAVALDQEKTPGAWTRVASGTTDSTGHVTLTATPQTSGALRVHAASVTTVAGVVNVTVRPDTVAPSVTAKSTPALSLGSTLAFGYAATDSGTGVANYDVRYRRAPFNGGFGSLQYPGSWRATTAHAVSIAAARGYTFCFSVRARDHAGNVSAWSSERCTASALDDRTLAASSYWTRSTGSSFYAGTITRASRTGVSLTRTSVQTKRIWLVGTRVVGGGGVGVYWNGVLIAKINLNATGTAYRQVFGVVTFTSVRSGTLTFRTLNSGKVLIDGLGLSRT